MCIQGKSCMLIAGDVYRPAAIDQLVILGKQVMTYNSLYYVWFSNLFQISDEYQHFNFLYRLVSK